MENSEFDKYIKSHTQKELEVPAGLSWEEMNIPLPEQKKKRRGFFWLWFGLLGVILIGALVLFLQPNQEVSKSIVEDNVIAGEKIPQTDAIIENSPSEMIQPAAQELKGSNPNFKQDVSVTNTHTLNLKNTKQPNVSKPVLTSDVVAMPSTNFQSRNSVNKISQKSKPTVQTSSNKTLGTIVSIQNIDGVELGLSIKNRTLPSLDLVEIENDNNNEEKNLSLFVNFGINQAWSNYSGGGNQLEVLTTAEDLAFGNSIQVGLKFPLKKKFFISTGVSYQKLHTTFTYSEDLGTEVNIPQAQSITRVKHIFHNNFFEFIELNVGVGKEFNFGKNWGSQLTLSVNPSYQLKATGRTLNDDLSVFKMENNYQSGERLFWSADGGVDLFFNIKNNRIVAGADWTQSFSKIGLLQDSNLQLQPQVLTFKLGLERMF